MRPLFAIAPLALLMALAGPRPVRWDEGDLARQEAAREAATTSTLAPALGSAPARGLAAGAERTATSRPAVETTSTVTRAVVHGPGDLGLGLRTVAAEAPSPHGRPR